jgi:hypothetical protein
MPNGTDVSGTASPTRAPAWTDDVEEAVALALFRKWAAEDDWPDHVLATSVRATWRRMAATTLSLLAEAGLLLPPGTKTDEERGTAFVWTYDGHFVDNGVERCVDSSCRNPHDRRRIVWTGPWTEVQP